jgi:preprotein translocase subunit SecA
MAAQPLSLAEFPRKAARIRAQIQAYEPELQALTNAALKSKREELRLTLLQEITRQRFPQEAKAVAALDAVRDKAEISARLAQLDPTSPADQEAIGKALESIEPLAFAVAGEACRRTLGKKPYGASMQFWEGRALATVLPAYLLSLTGNGVYLKQHNDYLAQRDVKTLRPILETLGLSVATATHHTQPGRQKQAYNANITYGSVPLRHDQVLGNLPTGKKWYVVDY